METTRKVHKIESTISLLGSLPSVIHQKKRVAAYARVSTDSDEQFTSYEAQVDFYTRYIQSLNGNLWRSMLMKVSLEQILKSVRGLIV